ncbi:hypothetical protein CW712_06155 [Candidatus Bathyarchaeota archaeon]|nr:MAG: hypothetical protein CW712_06155 [Candidatus Bathyarchaeota archaeon]
MEKKALCATYSIGAARIQSPLSVLFFFIQLRLSMFDQNILLQIPLFYCVHSLEAASQFLETKKTTETVETM